MAEEGYLPEDLPTEQETYDADAYFVVKKTTMSQARKMLLGTAVPKPNTLDAVSAGFNRDSVIMTLDDGAGNLYKITPNQIYEEISELDAIPSYSSSDLLRVADVTDTNTEKKYTILSLVGGIVTESTFTNAIDARFGNATFNTGVRNLFGDSTFNSAVDTRFGNATFNTEVDQEITSYVDEDFLLNILQYVDYKHDMYDGVDYYGEISIISMGRFVIMSYGDIRSADYITMDYQLPSAVRPFVQLSFGSLEINTGNGLPKNFVTIDTSGYIELKSTDPFYGSKISGSWITAS